MDGTKMDMIFCSSVMNFLNNCCGQLRYFNLPWHNFKLQSRVWGFLLPHMPPDPIWALAAIGFLVCVPGPQVLEHDDHFDHLQLSENKEFYLGI